MINWELVRDILCHVNNGTICEFAEEVKFKHENTLELCLHLELLIDADFIRGVTYHLRDNEISFTYGENARLTLHGYTALQSLDTDCFLDRMYHFARDNGLPFTIETFSEISTACAKSMLQ